MSEMRTEPAGRMVHSEYVTLQAVQVENATCTDTCGFVMRSSQNPQSRKALCRKEERKKERRKKRKLTWKPAPETCISNLKPGTWNLRPRTWNRSGVVLGVDIRGQRPDSGTTDQIRSQTPEVRIQISEIGNQLEGENQALGLNFRV